MIGLERVPQPTHALRRRITRDWRQPRDPAALRLERLEYARALVFAGVVQGFSTPPLMFLIMRMTGNRAIMGDAVNGRGITILGWTTTAAIFAATTGLVCTWFL